MVRCAPPKHGEISIIINNARNLTVWGDGKLIKDGNDVRMTLNGCSNSGVSPVESTGELVMLRFDSPSPAGSSLSSITLNDCTASNADLAIHSTFADKVMISGCRFSECAVPVNLDYKKADGAMSVTIKDSVFSSCGVTETQSAAIAAYSAPVRIVNQSGRAAEVMIEGISVLGTKSAPGDVLITDVRSGSAMGGRIIASFDGNSSDLSVRKPSVDDVTVTVLRGEQKTVDAGLLF